MRQYGYWLNNLTLDINNLFAYLYAVDPITTTLGEAQDILRLMNWLCSFKCLLLHNHLPVTPPMQEYIRYYADRIRHYTNLSIRLAQSYLTQASTNSIFKMNVAQTHIDNVISRLELLLDFAIHNSSSFDSKSHMYQTLYLLKILTSGLCPILHSEMVPFEKKEMINKMIIVLYYRIVQISNVQHPSIITNIQPTFISYVQTTTYQ